MSVNIASSTGLPTAEIEHIFGLIRSHPEHFSTVQVRETYASLGLQVFPDAFGRELSDLIVSALQTETPFSVIRLSDGEMNIMAFQDYPETPQINDRGFRVIMGIQEDLIQVDELWKILLRELLMSAVLQSDVAGVIGLWRRPGDLSPSDFIAAFKRNPRAYYGQWQGVDYMLSLARSGVLSNKAITSVHLYFGVLKHIESILLAARRIVLLTSHVSVVEKFRKKYPQYRFDHIPVGRRKGSGPSLPDRPDFLEEVSRDLPPDMRGALCLVGAGFWSEIYCAWIKQRGGVAVDIGSGFNLLDGGAPRPVHRALGLNQNNPFAL